jgi:hypothetical protein
MNQQQLCLIELCHFCGSPVTGKVIMIRAHQGERPAHRACAILEANHILRASETLPRNALEDALQKQQKERVKRDR